MREVDRVILMGEPHQEGHDEPTDITIWYRQERMSPKKYDITNSEDYDRPADITIGYRQARMPPQKYDITNNEDYDTPADITIGYRHACLPRWIMRIPWKVDTYLPPPSTFLLMIMINMIVSLIVISVINLIVIMLYFDAYSSSSSTDKIRLLPKILIYVAELKIASCSCKPYMLPSSSLSLVAMSMTITMMSLRWFCW